jgi:hypothetical protein
LPCVDIDFRGAFQVYVAMPSRPVVIGADA